MSETATEVETEAAIREIRPNHWLKTWPEFFAAAKSGDKMFEVRKDDRDFKVGQMIILEEFDPVKQEYTNWGLVRRITYKLPGGQFGIEAGYCVLGLEKIEP